MINIFLKSFTTLIIVNLTIFDIYAQWNPQPNWRDSYDANGLCWCDSSNFDHGLDTKTVNINGTDYLVMDICDELQYHPLYRARLSGDPTYNDIQCGNGPYNDAPDEAGCPGRVDLGPDGCWILGPGWDMDWLESRTRFGGNGNAIVHTIPGKIEAEEFSSQNGVQTEATSDSGGGLNVGYIHAGDYMIYNVDVAQSACYNVSCRIASLNNSIQFDLLDENENILASFYSNSTNGWQNWANISEQVELSAGIQTIKIVANSGNWNINWIDFQLTACCNVNASCNDGDVCTVNDQYNSNCECVGAFQDSDNDGICNANDNTNGNCTLNAACNDGDACTINDTYKANCECVGTFQDSDNDNTCDANDNTNGNCTLNAICNDNDACTINDKYNANCQCLGTFQDSDGDQICDAYDECPGSNDMVDTNNNNIPDGCETGVVLNIGVRVFLEGLLQSYGKMSTDLNSNDLIPMSNPFSNIPPYYSGNEQITNLSNTIVDWILLRVLDSSGNKISEQIALLNDDGFVKNVDGSSSLSFTIPNGDHKYLSIHHKSHLALIADIEGNSFVDFSQNGTALGVGATKNVYNKETMFAGDFDCNGIINNLDFNIWELNNAAVNQYLNQDADGNGIINNLDYNIWDVNKSKVGHSMIQN